jgi:hypothetical protein
MNSPSDYDQDIHYVSETALQWNPVNIHVKVFQDRRLWDLGLPREIEIRHIIMETVRVSLEMIPFKQ